ncbi:MAG: thioredoxin [Myxococcota bacterium]
MAGHTVEIHKADFVEKVKGSPTLLIDWWAPWCGPCRAFAPAYERVAEKNPDIVFAKINTEDDPELAEAFQIRSIPTLMVFRDGILIFQQAGALPEKVLEELIGKVREVDMDDVRKHIAEEEKKAAPQA